MRRYRFTPARRTALKIAQRKSAMKKLSVPNKPKKKKTTSGKNHIGYWVAKGTNKIVSTATFGVGPSIVSMIEGEKRTQKRQTYRWKK